MPEAIDAILLLLGWIALAVGIAGMLYGAAVASVVWASCRTAPRLWGLTDAGKAGLVHALRGEADLVGREGRRETGNAVGSGTGLSIIMPAHNEERVIDASIRSIRASTMTDFELIVVADRCSDQTVQIVRRHAGEDDRVRLVEKAEMPPAGWTGKCHAAWTGYQAANGNWLLFTDADTQFAPELIAACHRVMIERSLDLLSLVGHLGREHDFERCVQPLAAMTLMRMYPLHRANRVEPKARRPFANGQFLMFRRDAYERVGGHEAVKHAILEDLRFAVRMNNHGQSIGVGLAGAMFRVNMYATREAFVRGWKRIITEGANRNLPRLRAAAWRLRGLSFAPFLLLLSFAIGLAITAFTEPGTGAPPGLLVSALAGAGLLLNTAVFGWIYSMQGARWQSLIHLPRGAWQMANIVEDAHRDLAASRGIAWADLHYEVTSRDEAKVHRRQPRGAQQSRPPREGRNAMAGGHATATPPDAVEAAASANGTEPSKEQSG